MPNNNVAILSIMSKFDEKSAREAAKRADKVYEEALSDIGNVNFDKKLIENFDKAMNLLKNKFKKVNLSSYTNSLLDSIFSDKDIKEKSKDIDLFIGKIEMLKKASSGQDINAFNTFSAKQIDALISRTEKLAQKQEEINEKTREYNREATKIAKANRSISTIDKNYGNQDYSKTLESLKKSLGAEKEFTAEQNQSIENLAKMVNLYQTMEKSEPQKGTAEAIRYSKDLLAVTQKIKEERDKIDAFSQKGASAYIVNNGLSSIDKVSEYAVSKSKEDFVKVSLSNLKSQEAKLQSELTTYISESVQKNLAKVSKEVDAVVDKAEKRVENLQNKIESLQTKSTKIGSDNSIIGGIVSETDIKSLEEIEDRLYAISDLDADGEATKQQLKEYIQLYKQYEQLIASDSTIKFDPGLKEEYDFIVESDSKLKKYADTLDETISKQKELNKVKSNENEVSVDTQTEQLAKQEEQIKETIQAEKQLQDTQEKFSSNTKISVDAEQAITDINKIKESLNSIPEEKNIRITISDSDYTNTPLLSDAEGNTITAFRGVVGAWSGLINQDGIGFFTDKLKLAADYADSLAESGKIYQANLSFKNPLEVEGNGVKWDEIDFNGVKKTTDEIVELAKQLGHDGVIFKNIRDGFTDTEEDISNVMVALNAAQIKNEQVIGTVKAGSGEMIDVASKIDNATDTATNSTVESQNKIQEELKETQKVAEQVSEAMSNVSSDKSNISSENQNKQLLEGEEIRKNLYKINDEIGLSEEEFVQKLRQENEEVKNGNRQFQERLALLKDGKVVASYFGDKASMNIYNSDLVDSFDKVIHSHSPIEGSSVPSFEDLDLIFGKYKSDIKEFVLFYNNEMRSLQAPGDMSLLGSEFRDYGKFLDAMSSLTSNSSIYSNYASNYLSSIAEEAGVAYKQIDALGNEINSQRINTSDWEIILETMKQLTNMHRSQNQDAEFSQIAERGKGLSNTFIDSKNAAEQFEISVESLYGILTKLWESVENDGGKTAFKQLREQLTSLSSDNIKNILYGDEMFYDADGDANELKQVAQKIYDNYYLPLINGAKELKAETDSPMKDVFQGKDNSNTSFSSNLDEIEKEKSALLELKNTVSLITEEIDRKTQAFYNEKSAVDLIIPEEIATLESLERELKIIIESIEQISKIPINIDLNLENLDENSANAISKLKDNLSGFNGSSLTNISSILEGFKISKANVENLQKLSNAILTLKSNLNNVGNSGQQFLSDIKELVAQSDGLKDLATVLKSSQKQIDNAKKTTNVNVDSKNTEENANAWKELTYSIQRYSEVSRRISSGKALEGDIEEASRLENKISQLQKLDILSPTQIEKSEQMLTKLYDSLDDIEKKSKEATLESLNSSIDKYRNDYNSRSSKPIIDNQSDQYKKLLADYETSIEKLEAYRDKISNNPLVSKEDLNQIDKLTKKVKENATAFNSLTASQKGSTPLSRGKTIEWANDLLEQNSKWSKKAKIEVQGWINKLATADPSNVEEIRNRILEVVRAEREAGNAGKTWLDIFSTKKLHNFLGQAASMFSFYDLVNVGREGFQTIREYDNALTEMNKVSKESIETLKDFQKESFGLSDAIGTTASQIQNSTADFLRLGESFEQAKQSAQDANALFKVAEFDNIDEATEALVAMSQAYKELDKSQINDVLNYTGNNFSISTSELASALQRSAATLKVAGNDIYEATALVTAGNAVLQDAETVGSGLKMISLRILGTEEAKNELASLGEDVDDFVVQTQSKIDETVRSYTAVASNAFKGISVLDENGNYRSTYEILRDISLVYQEILEADKKAGTNRGQALLEVLAGKNRSNVAASILQSPELLTSVYEEAINNSQGSVAKELESQLQSIETHLNQLKNSWDKLWVNENNREVINFFLDLTKGILEVVDDIGVLNTAFIGIGAGLGIKNLGKTYEYTVFKLNCFEYALYA